MYNLLKRNKFLKRVKTAKMLSTKVINWQLIGNYLTKLITCNI